MTTNIDLEQLAQKNKIKLDYIIFKDELSKIPYKANLNIILNMSSTGHPGTHWIAVRTYNNMILYFDSFGVEPSDEILDYARINKKKVIYNDYQIQHLKDEDCGQLSLAFLALPRLIKSLD